MTLLERLGKADGFYYLEVGQQFVSYEENNPNNYETNKNKRGINAIYVMDDTAFDTIKYWQPIYYIDGNGNNVFDGYAETDYLGNDYSKLGSSIVKAGTWLFSPLEFPFTYIKLKEEPTQGKVILY